MNSAAADYVKRVRSFYEREVSLHGYNHRGLGYNRRDSQQRRFQVLSEVGVLHGRSVLDVGAGLGDLLSFLHERGVRPLYTGLDLCPHLVSAASARFRASDAEAPVGFELGDILEHPGAASHDYVLSSGIFGLAAPGTAERVRPTLARMLRLCRVAVAVNFLSCRAERHAERSLYLDPAEVLGLALELTPAVVLRHDYLPNDFTLFLYRQPPWPELGRASAVSADNAPPTQGGDGSATNHPQQGE